MLLHFEQIIEQTMYGAHLFFHRSAYSFLQSSFNISI